MRSLLRYCLALLLLIFLACGCLEARRVHGRHYYGKKHSKRMEHHDRRVKSALDCRAHERFVSCGPEPHCEKSCSNLYNPPSCQFDVDNPKCAYPRCICRDGYVRHSHGHCVPEWHCPEYRAPYGQFGSFRRSPPYGYESGRQTYW